MNQQEVWNKIADKWAEFRTTPIPEVLKFMKKQNGKLLDIGCGSGRHFIKKSNLEIYGLDFSKQLLKYAEKKKIAKELKHSKADAIPYPDNFFDSAIFISTLHCIPTSKANPKFSYLFGQEILKD